MDANAWFVSTVSGDLYHQEEPMTPETVRTLIWQLLVSVHYMHTCHVWHRQVILLNLLRTSVQIAYRDIFWNYACRLHDMICGRICCGRDIKSENVLLTGNLQAKLCDFGLSRSALEVCGIYKLSSDIKIPL